MRQIFTFLLFFLCFQTLEAQVLPKDLTVPLTATLGTGPVSVSLSWPNPGNANLLMLRRTKGQAGNAWSLVFNLANSNVNTLTDNGVAAGQTYEYVLQRQIATDTIVATGYAHVSVNAAAVNSRGKILIFVDSTTADALGVELVRLKNDMRGDGWWPIPFHTGPSSTVQSIKNQIIASYNADPTNVKAVLLLGNVPVPYSGNKNWDGHQDHQGAWPADSYYGDINGTWTDISVNNTTPARAANKNIPGDGKFDPEVLPSAVELQVGRVDFRHVDPAAFGAADQNGLMKRYLDKNHKWRIGDYPVSNKALIDDNFGYFGGEAFAENGFRDAYPLVGEANVVEADFLTDTNPQSYLTGYGCGGGSYTSAAGVATSTDFATDSINIVFTNLFGSYFGDWDYESNPLMPSALASRGGILTCTWAGRPHTFNHELSSGETIGYCVKETMNAQFNNGFIGSFGESGTHFALLGDPTLRANSVKPATNLTLSAPDCHSVALSWTASAEAVSGYHVYRALSQDGPYTRLTINPITGTTYTDNAALLDTLYYQVRAIKNVTTPGGGTYANNAVGPIKSIVFDAPGAPPVTATGGTLNCSVASVVLTATPSGPVSTWSWTGPNNFSSSQQNPSVSDVGTYTVTAFDAAGCSSTATAIVTSDYASPSISASVSNSIDCVNLSAQITVSPIGLSSCTITGPGNLFVQGFTATVTIAGTYTLTVVSSTNGCLGNSTVQVNADFVQPGAVASNNGPITCAIPTAQLSASSNAPGTSFAWSGPCLNGTTASCAGVYTVIVTNSTNGCTSSASTTVTADLNLPTVTTLNSVITCNSPTVPLVASVTPATAILQWTGPCVVPGLPVMASCAGVYTVIATNSNNGCSASATAIVTEDTQVPNIVLPPVPSLTCNAPCLLLTAPNIPGFEFYYLGQLIQPGTSIQICQPGTYSITVKSIANGCTKDIPLVVMQDVNPPIADAGTSATLSCNAPTVQLTGSGSSTGTYLWTGPGGFISTQQNPTVSVAGIYILTVTNPSNGCTASDQVEVFADSSLPTVNASANGQLNCSNQSVQLQSGNNDPGATFSWSPSAGLSCSTCPNPVASQPGTYAVVVSVGACSASDAVEVIKAPEFVVTSPPVLVNCDGVIGACVLANGGTPPYAYEWSNGSTENCATYVGSSVISVSVTDAGGCSYVKSETVVVPPPISIVATSTHNCSGPVEVCVTISGGTPPYALLWSNGSTAACATFLSSGTISLTVTDATGCTQTTSVVISQPPPIVIAPPIIVNESAPNAHNGSIDITVTGGVPGYTYNWSNGAVTQDITNLAGGTYTCTITDVNGCTQTVIATVTTAVGTEEALLFEQFLLSPNPTTGIASLSLKLHEIAALRVEIRDVAGRLIWEKPAINALSMDIPLDLSQSPAGMYSVSVLVDNQVFVRKLAVLR